MLVGRGLVVGAGRDGFGCYLRRGLGVEVGVVGTFGSGRTLGRGFRCWSGRWGSGSYFVAVAVAGRRGIGLAVLVGLLEVE